MLPELFSHKLFSLLERSGYIDSNTHLKCFWPLGFVCLSSNDTARDIQHTQAAESRVVWEVVDSEDCLHFEGTPLFWGMHSTTCYVKVCDDPETWGEIGKARTAPKDVKDGPIWDDVERTMLLRTAAGLVLTVPSLSGSSVCLARQNAAGKWEVGVCVCRCVCLCVCVCLCLHPCLCLCVCVFDACHLTIFGRCV